MIRHGNVGVADSVGALLLLGCACELGGFVVCCGCLVVGNLFYSTFLFYSFERVMVHKLTILYRLF